MTKKDGSILKGNKSFDFWVKKEPTFSEYFSRKQLSSVTGRGEDRTQSRSILIKTKESWPYLQLNRVSKQNYPNLHLHVSGENCDKRKKYV